MTKKKKKKKKVQKFSKKTQLRTFPSKFRAFGIEHPPKRYVVSKVFPDNKLFHFSKRALRVPCAKSG